MHINIKSISAKTYIQTHSLRIRPFNNVWLDQIILISKGRKRDSDYDHKTKILNKETVLYFSNIILGNSVAVDQSLNAYDTEFDNHFNDWGVVSAPDFTCMYA